MKNLKYQLLQPGQEDLAMEVVSSTFDEFVAPELSEEGIAEFYKFANVDNLATRSQTNCFTILVQNNNVPIGLIEIKDHSHISMFFVKKQFQKRGVGKALLQVAMDLLSKTQKHQFELTVNSSPNAVNAYKKMKFVVKSEEQCVNGIRFVPMGLLINTKIDS